MSADWTFRNECHCGHHRDSHFEGKHNCLGLYCECDCFVKNTEPLPAKPKKYPPPTVHPLDDDDTAPTTPRIPWPWP